jgi:hypothetical protein
MHQHAKELEIQQEEAAAALKCQQQDAARELQAALGRPQAVEMECKICLSSGECVCLTTFFRHLTTLPPFLQQTYFFYVR